MSANDAYTVFMVVGIFIAIGLGYVTWVITCEDKKKKHGH